MKFDQFTITVFFLFLPGLLCSIIVSKLTTHRDRTPVDHIIPSLVYGFVIFVVYGWIAASVHKYWNLPSYNIFLPTEPAASSSAFVDPLAILIAIGIGLVLAFLASAGLNHKWLHRVARWIGVTNKFGDRDVWSYLMNSDKVEWCVVRDVDSGLYYVGLAIAFSDEEDIRELLLSETVVYDNETGSELYDAGLVYLSFAKDQMRLEIPSIPDFSAEPKP